MQKRPWVDVHSGLLGPSFPLPLDRPFDRRTANAAGVPDGVLSRLVRDGVVRRVLQGVYAAAQVPDTVRERARAVALVLPPDTVVIGRTAGWLHGLPVLQRGALLEAPPVETGTTRDSRPTRRGVQGHRRLLSTRDITVVHGVPATTLLRTTLDLGRLLWRFDALAAIDAGLRAGADVDDLFQQAERFKGYRGVCQLRALLPLGDPRSESPGESALRLWWMDAGLPRAVPQYEVLRDDGGGWFRLDLAAPDVRYAAEYDGVAFHSSPTDIGHDEERRALLREQGWTLDVFTKDDVYGSKGPFDRLCDGLLRARQNLARWEP